MLHDENALGGVVQKLGVESVGCHVTKAGAIHQIVDGVGGLVGIDVLEWDIRGYLHGLFMKPDDKNDDQSRQDGRGPHFELKRAHQDG